MPESLNVIESDKNAKADTAKEAMRSNLALINASAVGSNIPAEHLDTLEKLQHPSGEKALTEKHQLKLDSIQSKIPGSGVSSKETSFYI